MSGGPKEADTNFQLGFSTFCACCLLVLYFPRIALAQTARLTLLCLFWFFRLGFTPPPPPEHAFCGSRIGP